MMKKRIATLACLCLLAALTGCGTAPAASSGSTAASSAQSSANAGDNVTASTEGSLGDTMSTAFFDFSVDTAEVGSSYGDYTASDGNQLVVVSMTLQNTDSYSMPMYDDDFSIYWGAGDEDYSYPVAGSLCQDFEIPINGSKTGDLVFEVPTGTQDYALSFQELFDNQNAGNTFLVHFTVEAGNGSVSGASTTA